MKRTLLKNFIIEKYEINLDYTLGLKNASEPTKKRAQGRLFVLRPLMEFIHMPTEEIAYKAVSIYNSIPLSNLTSQEKEGTYATCYRIFDYIEKESEYHIIIKNGKAEVRINE